MSVEVKLELGHRASLKEKPTAEGFTHDWIVFVRGAEGSNIQYFVEKVVFYLHESFPKPKRVVKDPPYSVSESGYAGFIMPIEVHFRTKEEPKKVRFEYDLFLRLNCPPVNNIRIEKLTFQNPSEDFRCKLLRAGGVGALTGNASGSSSLQTQACIPPPPVEDQSSNHSRSSVSEKKSRSHHSKDSAKSAPTPPQQSSQPQPSAPKPSQPFTDIFGAPIRTKSSPDATVKTKETGHSSSQVKSKSVSSGKEIKTKESHHKSSSHHSTKEVHHAVKENHHTSKEVHYSSKENHHSTKESHFHAKETHVTKEVHKTSHSTKESQNASKEHSSKEIHRVKEHSSKESHSSTKETHHSELKDTKVTKSAKVPKESKSKAPSKPPPVNNTHASHGATEKKRKHIEASSENNEIEHPKPKPTKESKDKTEKHKTKSSHSNSFKEKEKPKHKVSPVPVENKELTKPKPSSPPVPKQVSPISQVSSDLDSDSDESVVKSRAVKARYSSSPSSISSTSMDGAHAFTSVMSDMENVLSPLTSDDDVSPHPPMKRKLSSDSDSDDDSLEPEPKREPISPPAVEKKHSHHKSSKHKSSKHYRGNGSINEDVQMNFSPDKENRNNARYREELIELQQIIMSSNDRQVLQKIVDVIEKTGKYEVSNTSFDFDLCTLDYPTIKKLKMYLTNL